MELEIITIKDNGATFTVTVKDGEGELHELGFLIDDLNNKEKWLKELKELMKAKLKPKIKNPCNELIGTKIEL